MRKRVHLIWLTAAAFACLCLSLFITFTGVANTYTNSIFNTYGVTVVENTAFSEKGRMGMLVTGKKQDSFIRVDRRLSGFFEMDFGIRFDKKASDFTVSFFEGNYRVKITFVKSGDLFEAIVFENGEEKTSCTVEDADFISLTFNPVNYEICIDGSAVYEISNVVKQYYAEISFSEKCEENDGIIIFGLNGHKLSQSVITNQAGPSIFADFSVKACIGEFYYLPQPFGCDIIDGEIKDFDVEVKYGGEVIVGRTDYTKGMGFVPEKTGEYQISYFAADSSSLETEQKFLLSAIRTANYNSSMFSFDTFLETLNLGAGSEMEIPFCKISNKDLSGFYYNPLLTVKKDGDIIFDFDKTVIFSSDKFVFEESGIYEFIYTSENPNISGEKSFTVNIGSSLPAINFPKIAEFYYQGSEFEIPQVSLTVDGKNVKADTVINYPVSKKAVVTDSAVLDECGKYTLEYRTVSDGKTFSITKSFYVFERFYDYAEGDAYWAESTIDEDVYGVLVNLPLGETFALNEIINISGKKASDPILSIDILPENTGAYDFMQLNIKLTDIYDESNYVTVSCRVSRDDSNVSYIKAGYKNQPQCGVESSQNIAYFEPSIWGEYIMCSFSGDKNNTFTLSFDYENKAVYANEKKIVELNNPLYFSELWEGFTTGECKVSISAQEYFSMNARFLLTYADGKDLTQQYLKDDVAPEIEIETEYSENNLPAAQVGVPYKVFDASAYDVKSGETDVKTAVYYAYSGSAKGQINIVDGQFTPFIKGKYTIEYKSYDAYGNCAVKTLEVSAYDSLDEIVINEKEHPTGKLLVGRPVEIADYGVSGPSGNAVVSIKAKLKDSSISYDVTDYSFTPLAAGDYEIIYTAVDYLGRVAECSYEITVINDGLPVFRSEAELPFVFIQGVTYELPLIEALTFDGDAPASAEVTVSVTDGNGINIIKDNIYTPSVEKSGDSAVIVYTARGSKGNAEKSYSVPVKIIKTGQAYDMTQYFLTDNAAVSSDDSGIIFTVGADESIRFIRPLIADNFNMEFDVNADKNDLSNVDIFISDVENPEIRVKFSFINKDGKAYMSLNDNVAVKTASAFDGSSDYKFLLSYDGESNKLSDAIGSGFKITETISGEEFQGFPSGKIYLEFCMKGVTGEAEIKLSSISGQPFNNIKGDFVRPQISINGNLGGTFKEGSVYDIPSAFALDVLDPVVNFVLTVENPDGTIAVDTDGNQIADADPTVERQMVLSQIGIYLCTYTATDTSRRVSSFSISVSVPDLVPPVIEISGSVPASAKLNEKITLPAAKAYKNGEVLVAVNSEGQTVDKRPFVFVITPEEIRENVSFKQDGTCEYLFSQSGTYTIVYLIEDDAGNVAEQRVQIKV